MFESLFTKKNTAKVLTEEDNIIALDIGTEQLKTFLFNVTNVGVNIKKISRIEQQQNAMKSGIITNLDTVLENCKLGMSAVVERLSDEEMPKKVIMDIAGEYIQGVSIVVNYQREENFDKEISESEQSKIVTEIEDKIKSTGKEDLSQRIGLTSEDIEILHITRTGLRIGGMPVNSLIGYKGKDVVLYYYASFAPKTYVEALRKVASDLNMEVLGIVAQPFAVARSFSGASNRDFSAIFIDIGGGTTDIAIVEKGNVVETKMFAFGGRTFTKEISKALNLDYRYAEQRKIKYSNKELTSVLSREIQKVVYPTAMLWMKTLSSAFKYCDDINNFPTQVYLCGGGALLPEIKEVMLEYPWRKNLPFASVPKIDFYTPDKMENVTDNSGELKYLFDITPAALTKFVYDNNKTQNAKG